ncbi:sigma factor-like helix-turn-helix DNA-binding protein [Streptomyces tauricus]|uniref:sigma factor-like helix-turn-helix DNA-binding protein n=1 Tax=Streptomyces tauricus TaxID=68274 RepID=UPI0033A3C766
MDDDFTARAGEYWPRLTRTARLLTGNSADADRRARAAVAEVYARRRLAGDDAEFYVRRALVRGFLRRRPGLVARLGHSKHSKHSGSTPEPYAADPFDPLTEVLAGLPPRRRAVAVLRHWDGLTHREIAALLNSSRGAVKAVDRRAEKALRAHAAHHEGIRDPYGPLRDPRDPRDPQVPDRDGSFEVSALPAPAIEAAGRTLRTRRRRTTAVLTSVGALLLVPLVVGAVRGTGAGSGGVTVSVERAAVRVVTPGERVAAAPGVQFWLSKDGTHLSAPGQPNQFRDVGKGEAGSPALTLWADSTTGKRIFLSGVHRGTREASRVEVRTPDGTFAARLLTLAGSPGWSSWYVDIQLTGSDSDSADAGADDTSSPGITVKAYDSAGTLLAWTDTPS